MFKDTKEALERLDTQLRQEQEAQPPESPSPEPAVYHNFSNNYGRNLKAYNTDRSDEDLDSFSEAVREPRRSHGIWGLIVTALCLTAGIVAVLFWWMIRFNWG